MQTLLSRDQGRRNQADRILSSSSTSGLEGKEVTAHRAPTFFTFGRSHLLNKQTNKQLFEEILILVVTLIRALTGFKPDAVEGSLESYQV